MKTFSDYNIDLMGKVGTEIRVLCPQCSPTRKKTNLRELCVNTESGAWFCQHCGWSGGLGADKKFYIKPEYTAEKSKLPEKVTEWFKTRGISTNTLEAMKIGYGPIWMPSTNKEEQAIQFPFYKNGVVVNIKYRDGHKNFRQAKGAEKVFYGLDRMTNTSDTLIITEGEIDTLSFIEAGFSEVVSMPDGAPAANAKSYNTKFNFLVEAELKLSKYKKIILAVDNDEPGKRAEEELSRRLGPEKCLCVKYPAECKDANDTLVKYGRRAVKDLVKNATPLPIDGIFTTLDVLSKMKTLYKDGVQRGVATGWPGMDNLYSVRPGELTVITGIPGSGKSNWLDCLMINLAEKEDWSFAVFSPENWPIERHACELAQKIQRKPFMNSRFQTSGRMTEDELEEAAYLLSESVFFIQPDDEQGEPTVDLILDLAKKEVFRHGIKGLIIDPWAAVSTEFGNLTETQFIQKALGKIRRFGRLNGVHIFLVAHPQKQQKQKDGKYAPPTMYDISGGAHWRNLADNGICVHRLYEEGFKDNTQIYIQKIRFRDVGEIGMHTLRFDLSTSLYIDDLPNGR